MKTKIYVAAHKPFELPPLENYSPLFVGRNDLEPNDSTGESIGERNPFYCELTGQYWIWKNDRSEVVGLCQYRRLLWIDEPPRTLCSQSFRSIEECAERLDTRSLASTLDKYDVILPRAYAFSRDTIGSQFVRYHRRENFDRMLRALERTHPNYMPSVEKTFARRTAHLANLLISRKDLFDEYSRWLFDVLFDIESRSGFETRMAGYMSERLLNLFVEHNRLRVKEVPLIFISDQAEEARIDLRYLKRKYFPALLSIENFFRRK